MSPDRKPTKRERREQQRTARTQSREAAAASALTRRRLIIGGSATLATVVVVGSGAMALEKFAKHETEEQRIKRELDSLDLALKQNPDRFSELASKITSLAENFFLKEIGAPNQDKTGLHSGIHFQDSDTFKQNSFEVTGCKRNILDGNTVAYIHAGSDDIYFNKTYLKEHPHLKNTLASSLFITLIHELHHVRPKKRQSDFSANIVDEMGVAHPATIIRGAGLHAVNTFQSQENKDCYTSITAVEEAIVIDSTSRMILKLGINHLDDTSEDMRARAQNYQTRVLIPLFNGDHKQLLGLQQASRAKELFQVVGQKLGFTGDKATSEGFTFLLTEINR